MGFHWTFLVSKLLAYTFFHCVLVAEKSIKLTDLAARFPQMIENVGYKGSTGIIIALIIVGSVVPTIAVQWQGHRWRT